MKKILVIMLSLVMLLSFAACAATNPSSGSNPPATDNPPATTEGGDIVIGGNNTKPTDAPTEAPTDAPTETPTVVELADSGYCAVGIVNAEAGTAKVLGDNGAIAEIKYNCEGDPVPGKIYTFTKNGDAYDLAELMFLNSGLSAWNVRLFDNSALGTPDQIYTHDGVNETLYDLDADCVIFCRFSETEWRIFRGSDAVQYSEWPCACYFTALENPNGGNKICTVMLICSVDANWVDGHANEASTYFFDKDGFGWSDGDLIIE